MSSDEDMFSDAGSHEFEEYQEDFSFAPVIAEKDKKKPYQVDFKIFSVEEMERKQASEISHVTGILGTSSEHSSLLLRFYKWNKESLIEEYLEDPEKVNKSAGYLENRNEQAEKLESFQCDICCSDGKNQTTFDLGCGHRFCLDCYKYYLEQKVVAEGESKSICCPGINCPFKIDETTMRHLVSNQVYQKYKRLLMKAFVEDNKYMRWCPARNCDYVVECKVLKTRLMEIVPIVECKCKSWFCFGCGLDDHMPCPCELVRLWMKKCQDDSETSHWLNANTKECPKCQSTIEKNGGCNHMTCRKCKNEFCWVCMGSWKEHGTSYYQCNRFNDQEGINARNEQEKSRAALKRYLHYYNRFANHDNSIKLDNALYSKTDEKMEAMQKNSGLSWIDVQFLKNAVHILLECRLTLKWTYTFAFYLERSSHTSMFEDNQRDLEVAVEHLSELLEMNLDSIELLSLRQQVIDTSVYVKNRREILLTDTAAGLTEHRWQFNK